MDHATGRVVNASFSEKEGARSYFLLIQGLVAALWHTAGPLHRPARGLLIHLKIQFGRCVDPVQPGMDEMGIQMIFALSPQAKGRVERAAGTLQDRLVTELRLAEATTIEQANTVLEEVLTRLNRRFRVPAQCAPNLHSGPGVLSCA